MAEQEEFGSFSVTLKADGGHDAPWVVIRSNDRVDLNEKLLDLQDGDTLKLVATLAKEFHGLYLESVKPAKASRRSRDEDEDDEEEEERPTRRSTRGSSTQSSFRGGSSSRQRDKEPEEHPEGTECKKCEAVLIYKKIKSHKGTFEMWSCPRQKEKGDGHTVEWI